MGLKTHMDPGASGEEPAKEGKEVLERPLKGLFKGVWYYVHFKITLESRLDFILYKAGFGFTVIETKNLIMHGHVFLNEKNILNPKTQIKKGDHIKIKNSNNIKNKMFKIRPTIENGLTINYMHVNYKIFEIVIIKDLHFSNTIQNFNFYLKLSDL